MKTLVFAFCAVFSTALIAESQTPSDVLYLDGEESGLIEVTTNGEGVNQLVNINCEDASISDILKQFRKIVKANIISCDATNLHKRVSISLYDMPWVDSLRAVLAQGGFALDERNGIYTVSPEQVENPIVRTKSFELNHASADETAKLLNESFGEKDKKTGRITGNVASVFKDANVIVVKGTDKIIRDCEEVISSVDKAPEQVYIEARFIELSTTAMHELGVKWDNLKDFGLSTKNVKIGWENNSGRLAKYGGTQSEVGDGSVAAMDSVNGTEQMRAMNWSHAQAFSGQISADDFRLAMSAFESMQDVKVFSNPRIIVSNGKQAQVDMTTKYPNVRVTASRSGGAYSDALDITAQLEQIPGEESGLFSKDVFFSWGIELKVTPRISPDGLINVEIIPSISNLAKGDGYSQGFAQVEGGSTANGSGSGSVYSKYPVIDMQRLVTDFTMKDGSTAVIGGLTRTQEEDVDDGIPYLRKIPLIGSRLFGWKGRQKVQKEIIVFVTVGVANPRKLRKDIGLPKNAILGREYVNGSELEPGDRTGKAEMLDLDMENVDSRAVKKAHDRQNDEAFAAKAAEPEYEAAGPTKGIGGDSSGPSKEFVLNDEAEAEGPKLHRGRIKR